jgi:predicted RNA-binding Zn-ribbon protein involved in translation (DUF1610 family)
LIDAFYTRELRDDRSVPVPVWQNLASARTLSRSIRETATPESCCPDVSPIICRGRWLATGTLGDLFSQDDASMAEQQTSKGPWTHRFLVHLFTVGLTVLMYWLLGFVIGDIGSWPGPDYSEVEQRLLDPKLLDQQKDLSEQIAETERDKKDQQTRQMVLRDSTSESQRTMSQLLDFQRLSLEKNVTPSEEEQKVLAESQQLFLKNQKQYQLLNKEVAQLDEQLRDLQQQQRDNEQQLETARKPVNQEFGDLSRRHDLKMAAIKLAVLVPLLVVAVVLLLKMRTAPYAPLVYAFGIAVLLKVGLVMHEYFPTRYFKYVLILASLIIVGRILVSLLRAVAFPKREWLLKQYREAYERFFCPVCEYPIRRGPLKYLFWNRRSIKKLSIPPTTIQEPDGPYTCPMCATKLYEECESCHAVRHSLLPACENCGSEKPVMPLAKNEETKRIEDSAG